MHAFLNSIAVASLVLAVSPVSAQHVHGHAELNVAVAGDVLTISLRSPLDSLLGFEHAPRTAAQKAAAAKLLQALKQPETVFVPDAAAHCAPQSALVDAPVLGAGPQAKPQPAGGQTHRHGHAELVAEFVFKCRRPDELRALEVKLFEQYKRLRRLDARVAGPRGQSAARLTAVRSTLRW